MTLAAQVGLLSKGCISENIFHVPVSAFRKEILEKPSLVTHLLLLFDIFWGLAAWKALASVYNK